MNMRSRLWAVVAVTAGGLLGCGNEPRYYRVAIDRSPLDNLPSTCYASGTAPVDKTTSTVDVAQWIVWDGVEGRKYLQVGAINFKLGDAYRADIVGDAIVNDPASKEKVTFVAERTVANPNRVYRATYTFDKLGGGLEDTLEGTLTQSSTCTPPNCNNPNCEVSLPFVGRRIDADSTVQVPPSGG